MPPVKNVHLISLGCPKNRIDSEVILGRLLAEGYRVVDRPEEAEVLVVNTCAFIDAAKEESIDTILELAAIKKTGKQTLVVAGCLSQRFGPALAKELPEVDFFVGTGGGGDIGALLARRSSPESRRAAGGLCSEPGSIIDAATPRAATLPPYTTYVRISEGCSNDCAFCIIPRLRGPQRSRSIEDIVAEIEGRLERGVVELNLIAQDLCAYGRDLTPPPSLAQLLRVIDNTAGSADRPVWIRCLYAYPRGLTRELRRVVANGRHIVPYLDVPLQHVADGILRRMRRGKGGEATKQLVRELRSTIPGLTLRTTLITGLPGETEADFAELMAFVEEARFERLGVFAFSPEEGTGAATMPGQVAPEVALERRDRLLCLQQGISRAHQTALIGRTVEVLVEGIAEESELLLQGRHAGQAPEIDGSTYITAGTAAPGEVVSVRIEEAAEYDVAGPIIAPPGGG